MAAAAPGANSVAPEGSSGAMGHLGTVIFALLWSMVQLF